MKSITRQELNFQDFKYNTPTDVISDYVRPSSWLSLPSVTSSDQKLVGLVAVYNGYNNVSIQVTGSGSFVVNWGDGSSAQTYTSGTTASYSHSYSSFSGQSATPYGYKQAIVTVTPASGQTITAVSFNVTAAGRPTTDISNWLDIVMSFPSMTTLTLGSASGVNHAMLRSLSILNCIITTYDNLCINCYELQKVYIINNASNPTSAASTFSGCSSLIEVNSFKLNTVTSTASMFLNCKSLQVVPPLDISASATAANMFQNCRNLVSVNLKTTSALKNTTSMFATCTTLANITKFDTSGVTTTTSMFSPTYCLRELPDFNWSAVTTATQMFADAISLRFLPPRLNFTSLTNSTNMFNGCRALVKIPYFNAPSLTNASGMFSSCFALKSIYINAPALITATQMFNTCESLVSLGSSVLGGTVTPTITSINTMFNACNALQELPSMNLASCTDMSTAFASMRGLISPIPTYTTTAVTNISTAFNPSPCIRSIPAFNLAAVSSAANIASLISTTTMAITSFLPTGIRFTFTLANQQLDAAALNTVYTNLGTGTGQTITVSGNPGTTGDNPAIATAKGWTVAGT